MNEIYEISAEELQEFGYTEEDIISLFSSFSMSDLEIRDCLRSNEENEIRRALRYIRLYTEEASPDVFKEELKILLNNKEKYIDDTCALLCEVLWLLKYKTVSQLLEEFSGEQGNATLSTLSWLRNKELENSNKEW